MTEISEEYGIRSKFIPSLSKLWKFQPLDKHVALCMCGLFALNLNARGGQ